MPTLSLLLIPYPKTSDTYSSISFPCLGWKASQSPTNATIPLLKRAFDAQIHLILALPTYFTNMSLSTGAKPPLPTTD